MRALARCAPLLALPAAAFACPTCPSGVRAQVVDGIAATAGVGAAAITLPVAAWVVGAVIAWKVTGRRRMPSHPALLAGAIFGMGMIGLLDGLFLHHIMQWHQLISARLAPDTLVAAKVNMFWDGLFHAGMWTAVAIGGVLLARTVRQWGDRRNALAGAFIGAGAFNLLDGLISHHLFSFHRTIDGTVLPDFVYLAVAALMLAIGWFSRYRPTATTAPT